MTAGLLSVVGVYRDGESYPATEKTDRLDLDLQGMADSRYRGFTRRSGGREPWYPRGTVIRNDRQLTLVALEELAKVAEAMGLSELDPGWLGASIAVTGDAALTALPRGTRLVGEGEGGERRAVLVVTASNLPCRKAGQAIARASGRDDAARLFPKRAMGRRGLIACVEREGILEIGDRLVPHRPDGP